MQLLFVIPARGGSKGIPGKNIKLLNGKPLIHYSIEYARKFATDKCICVSTDSDEIAASAESIQLKVPFKRPAEISTDTAASFQVLKHALAFYEQKGMTFDAVVLLQPTSPLRQPYHLEAALRLYNATIDMVVSVRASAANPYYNLFEEDSHGYLHISKGDGRLTRRQDAPVVYEYNGSIYIINPESLRDQSSVAAFRKIKKYLMEEKYSVDLDTMHDWSYLEFILQQHK